MLRQWLYKTLASPKLERALEDLVQRVPDHDPWGFSPKEAQDFAVFAHLMYRYFRPVITGIETLPAGRVLVVPNHSGQLPFDGLIVGTTCLLEAPTPRMCRAMVERWVPTLPFINVLFSRSGAVLGDPINCRNLLEQENAILVFPEGAKGSGKVWKNRYKLERFGRGFMRLALQTNTPIVPVSVVGAEEAIISIHDGQPLADRLGVPYIPISPLLPILGPLAYLPLPTRFYIDFGPPMYFDGPFDDEDEIIDVKVQNVKDTLQNLINDRLAKRTSIF